MTPPDVRALVIGASGVVGRALMSTVGPQCAVGTFTTHPFAMGIPFDLTRERVQGLLSKTGGEFTHGIILAAKTNIDECARNPDVSFDLNVRATIEAINDLHAAGIVPVFVSSDAVFDGTAGRYADDAKTDPILTYGKQKALVEAHCRTLPKPCLILRLSKVVSNQPETGMFGEWMQAIRHGQPIRCAGDQFFSPVQDTDVASAIVALAQRRVTGLFNVGGPDRLSRLDLARLFSKHLAAAGRKSPDIVPCSIRDFSFFESRPLDTSLDSGALYRATGLKFRTMDDCCAEAVRNLS